MEQWLDFTGRESAKKKPFPRVGCARLPCASLARLSPCSSYSISTFSRVCSPLTHVLFYRYLDVRRFLVAATVRACNAPLEYRMYMLSRACFSAKFLAATMSKGSRIDRRLRTCKLVELFLFVFARYFFVITEMERTVEDQYDTISLHVSFFISRFTDTKHFFSISLLI